MFCLLAGMSNVLIALMYVGTMSSVSECIIMRMTMANDSSRYKQAGNRYDQKTRQAMNRIAGVVIFAMFNVYCCVQKFHDKKDPPKEEK